MTEVNINEQQLDKQLSQLEEARAWSPRVISKLETFIRSAPDFDLLRVNPLQYAAERNMAESEAVDLFLYAAKIGLFEMDWHIVCPHCGFIVNSMHSMTQLKTHNLCSVCGVERDYSLDDYILVAFTVSPQVRHIQYHHPDRLAIEDLFFNYRLSKDLISPIPEFPSWRDIAKHITKYIDYVNPGQKITTELDVSVGSLRATNPENRSWIQLSVTETTTETTSHIPLKLINGKFHSDDPEMQPRNLSSVAANNEPVYFYFDLERELPNGKVVIDMENLQDRRSAIWIYQPPNMPPPVLQLKPSLSGKKLLTTQTFSNLFRSQVIQSGEAISIKDITFLFTDLKGSTAMYEQIGDANAYFLVQQHFDALSKVIYDRHGAIVKTIGDAVMAVFENPVDTTNAALEMIESLKAFNQTISQKLILKVGVHRGASIAVTVNERNDYFGQTVNIAARVQALADSNEVYITADVYNAAGVAETLQAHHVAPDEVLVKGVSEKLHVYKIGMS